MINHARTLLLNVAPQRASAQDAGYEYIPPNYKAVALRGALKPIYTALFGVNPDQRFLNMRALELLTYVHQTELAHYIYDLDQRVTYWPTSAASLQIMPAIKVTQVAGAPRQLSAGGEFRATNAAPIARRQYFVALTTADQTATLTNALLTETSDFLSAETVNEILLQETANSENDESPVDAFYVKQLNTLVPPLVVPVQNSNQLPAVVLPETQVRIAPSTVSATTSGARWLVDLTTNPPPAITTILPTLELLGEPASLELFGVAEKEPYATFKNLWREHPLPTYRLAGFVLAYIYRLNEHRDHKHG